MNPKKRKKLKFCLKSIIAWISSYTLCVLQWFHCKCWSLAYWKFCDYDLKEHESLEICFVVEDLLEILWFGKESYFEICCDLFGVKILLVWRAWDLSCWLEVHLHVSFIMIWGNESYFKICYNLKLKVFHRNGLAICFVVWSYFEICCNLELNVVRGLKFVSNCF